MVLRRDFSISADLESAITLLLARRLPEGGFAETDGGDYRPDATAWAIVCLQQLDSHPDIVAAARSRLVESQLPNGSIPIATEYPEAFWPTSVAALALHQAPRFSSAHGKAIDFLLHTSGRQLPKESDSPIGHDSMIPGWPWTDRTHSWVAPTALAVRALVLTGKSDHERVRAGSRLLLDRQLPEGGWNYGNTTVFGKTLRFMPATTGMALWALVGLVGQDRVTASLDLIERQLPELHTPLSLGWALLGLSAWNIAAGRAEEQIANCLQRQQKQGPYGTSQLAILLAAAASSHPGHGSHA